MRKLMLALFIILACAARARGANFAEVLRSESVLIYVDLDSIRSFGDYVVVWEKWIPRGQYLERMQKRLDLPMVYHMDLSAYNLKLKQFQRLAFMAFDSGDEQIYEESANFAPYRYVQIIEGTLGDYLYDFVMEYFNTGIAQQ